MNNNIYTPTITVPLLAWLDMGFDSDSSWDLLRVWGAPNSYAMGTVGSFPGNKAAGVRKWRFIAIEIQDYESVIWLFQFANSVNSYVARCKLLDLPSCPLPEKKLEIPALEAALHNTDFCCSV